MSHDVDDVSGLRVPVMITMPQLMSITVSINGQDFRTVDTPEAIGPWIARIFDVVRPGPGSSIRITV